MKSLIKFASIVVCMLCIVACGSRYEQVNLKKTGILYKIGDDVSFYYPNTFEIDVSNSNTTRIDFKKGDEVFFYSAYEDKTDNALEDRDELYSGELEQNGASDIIVSKPIMNSGLTSYEIVGEIKETGIKFKHLVYFSNEYTYVYGYIATSKIYGENIEDMTIYLQSIVINHPVTK